MSEPSPAPPSESPAQQQARLRRERMQAKIKAGGSSRLEKITQLSGRPAEPAPPPPSSTLPSDSNDPDEVDISDHAFRNPSNSNTAPTEADLRQFLRSGSQPNNNNNQGNNGSPPSDNPLLSLLGGQPQGDPRNPPNAQDPMMQMIQQMMSGMPQQGQGGGGDAPPGPGGIGGTEGEALPPGLAAMLGGGAQATQTESQSTYIWKIVHALFALTLGIYITISTPFTGSKLDRNSSSSSSASSYSSDAANEEAATVMRVRNFFWIFATAELVLQSSRFFLERGKTAQSGMLGMLANFLPPPWKGYVLLVGRYSGIWNTVVQDGLVVVFVLGAVAWWWGGGAV